MKNKFKVFLKKASLKKKIRDCEKVEYELMMRETSIIGRIAILKREKEIPINAIRVEYFDREIENLEDLLNCFEDVLGNTRANVANCRRQLDELRGK